MTNQYNHQVPYGPIPEPLNFWWALVRESCLCLRPVIRQTSVISKWDKNNITPAWGPRDVKVFKNHWLEEELKEWHDYKIYNIVIKLPDPWWSEQKPN